MLQTRMGVCLLGATITQPTKAAVSRMKRSDRMASAEAMEARSINRAW